MSISEIILPRLEAVWLYLSRFRFLFSRWGLAGFAAFLAGSGALSVWIYWLVLSSGGPEIPGRDELWRLGREPSIVFVDARGETIATRGPRYGRAVRLDDLPDHVIDAFLAVEDHRFFDHDGVDRKALMRASWRNLRAGQTVEGGSTITQQLVKNLFFDSRQTLKRKAQEMKLAWRLESMLTKEEILELYLNRIYLGGGAYGVDGAARRYFDKPAADLELAEAALLAGLPKAPSRFAPTTSEDEARERRAVVLSRMRQLGVITGEESAAANAAPVAVVEEPLEPDLGYALDLIAQEAQRLTAGGAPDIVVHATIDTQLQKETQEVLARVLAERGAEAKAEQAALVLIDRQGEVKALIGGKSYAESQFNRATQARRQPGSVFKTFVFAAGLEAGFDPDDVFSDQPIEIEGWNPQNYGGGFSGRITMRSAFAKSVNTVAVQIGVESGLVNVAALARRFGVTSALTHQPSITLGASEITLWELAQGVSVIWNEGARRDVHIVKRITDTRGKVLYERPSYPPEQVYDPEHAREMISMMAHVVRKGTGTDAAIPGFDVAGKTGTSQNWRDAWFVGFTGPYLGAVWVGNDDDSPMNRVTGGDLPTAIWRESMIAALGEREPVKIAGAEPLPDKIVSAEHKRLYESIADVFARTAERHARLDTAARN